MEFTETFRDLLRPLDLELYDIDFSAGTLHVTVRAADGLDVERLSDATRVLARWLDENDPIEGRYVLDVSSPGLERRLRTPEHFAGAIGEVVTLRERRSGEATRRLQGVLRSANGTTVTLEDAQAGLVEVVLSEVERARTVFEWGPTPKSTRPQPKKSAGAGSRAASPRPTPSPKG
jgi:ribosome maturation factor RimP